MVPGAARAVGVVWVPGAAGAAGAAGTAGPEGAAGTVGAVMTSATTRKDGQLAKLTTSTGKSKIGWRVGDVILPSPDCPCSMRGRRLMSSSLMGRGGYLLPGSVGGKTARRLFLVSPVGIVRRGARIQALSTQQPNQGRFDPPSI